MKGGAETTGRGRIGRRLERLLTDDYTLLGRPHTREMQAARKAEADGLIVITGYYADGMQRIEGTDDVPTSCDFRLTDQGVEMRSALLAKSVPVVKTVDEDLAWLLAQSSAYRWEGYGEPEASYGETGERLALARLGQKWVDHAAAGLGLDPGAWKFTVTLSEEAPFAAVLASASAFPDEGGPELRFELLDNGSIREPVVIAAALVCSGPSRDFFRQALGDYPKILDGVLGYAHGLKFRCWVGLDNEPRANAPAMQWLRVYFADEDVEEEFALECDLGSATTVQTIRRNMLGLTALYDAATAEFEGDADRLVTHYQTIMGRRLKGRRSR